MKKQCWNCVNDQTVKKITFDEKGLCNFCNSYQKIERKIHNYQELEKNFLKRINKGKNKHQYDVALGISGGKDSTYVLYKLVKEYHLKVKAFTLDNGFLSDEAKIKIDSLVKELEVEHEYVICDERLLKKAYRYITTKYLSPCIACSYLGYAAMINYASKVDASVGMHGRSIYQMLRNYHDDDPFKPLLDSGLLDVDQIDFFHLYQESLQKINRYIDKNLAIEIENTLLKDAKEKGYRDFIAYFLYHPYDKKEIVDFITNKTNWLRNDEEHFDCLIHNGAEYLKNLIARRAHLMPEISVMIREGKISRLDALKIVYADNIKYPKDEIERLCRYANINKRKLLLKAKIYSKRWW